MKKRVLAIFMVIITVATAGIIFSLKYILEPEISREEYPFVGMSVNSSSRNGLTDTLVFQDLPLDIVVERLDYVVIGSFVNGLDTATQFTDVIIPKEGTSEYKIFSDIAEESGQSLEEVCPKRSFYEFLFEVSDSYGGDFNKGDIITVNVKTSDFKDDNMMFSAVKEGAKAVLLLKHNTYNTADFYSTTSLGYYYIDEHERVISAEAFPGLDKYSGYKVEDFSKVLKETYDKTRQEHDNSGIDKDAITLHEENPTTSVDEKMPVDASPSIIPVSDSPATENTTNPEKNEKFVEESPMPSEVTSADATISKNMHGGEYFSSEEAEFNGIVVNETTLEQLLELLGESDKVDDLGDGTTAYYYNAIEYRVMGYTNKVVTIVINGFTEHTTPRGIKVGDSLESVFEKFPYEKDPEVNDGVFFGESTMFGAAGRISDEVAGEEGEVIKKITVTSEDVDPFMMIKFKEDVVYEIVIRIRTN